MARELVNPPDLHPAPGFSHVAIAEGTRVVHFAGQLGLNPDFSLVAGDLRGQTIGAMRNLEIAMADGRCRLGRRGPAHDLHERARPPTR